MAQETPAVVVMARYPQAGRVKTRLSPALTPQQAAGVYRHFLTHLVGRLRGGMAGLRLVVCHDPPDAGEQMKRLLGDGGRVDLLPQAGGDLGQRMAAAADAVRAWSSRVLVLGADSPDVPDGHLRRAMALLERHDVVLGPTADGGYWCMGMGPGVDAGELLAGIDWSSGRERVQTLEAAARLGYDCRLADGWEDVDDKRDLAALLRRLYRSALANDCNSLPAMDLLVRLLAGIRPDLTENDMTNGNQANGGAGDTRPEGLPNTESFLANSKVLIVDDNPQNLELLQAFVESLPVKVITARDGAEAMQQIALHHPDLVLLDIMMPRISGFQVCDRIKKDPSTRDIQVLMVTALHGIDDIEEAADMGADDFVSKPVSKIELITRVKSLLRVRHLKNELERALSYIAEVDQEEQDPPDQPESF